MKNPMAYTKDLTNSGFTKDQAHSTIKVMWEIMEYKFASKDDLENTQIALSHQAEEVQVNLGHKIEKVKDELSNKIEEVDTRLSSKIDEVETKLTNKIDEVDIRLGNRIDKVEVKIDNLKISMEEQFKYFEKSIIIKLLGVMIPTISGIMAVFKWLV